ncbi:MAG: hypothetical protein FJY83_09390, partial [Candidatus Aminicenantes bacterium]|nr:hypothetical protein [Candidatus Aminicenantes bacterium]
MEIGALRYGMSGIVTYARHSNMAGFLQELDEARRNQVRLLVTLGSVSIAPFYHQPSRTFDAAGYYAQE